MTPPKSMRDALQETMVELWGDFDENCMSVDEYLDDCAATPDNILDFARLPLLYLRMLKGHPNIDRLYREVSAAADVANHSSNPMKGEVK
jgi:hypothetical protein